MAWKGEASYRLRAKMMLQRLRRGWLARLLRGIWWSVGALGGLLAASWEPLAVSLGPLWGRLGASWELLGVSWVVLGVLWDAGKAPRESFW